VRHAVGAGRGAAQAVDQGGQAQAAGDGAGQVEGAAPPLGLAEHAGGEEREHQADRHVHEEHPPPVGVLGQQAAGDQADRTAGHAHRGVHAHRPVARRALGERDRDQRQRGRRGERAADALQDAGPEQPLLTGGEAAEQRGQREQQDAGDEDPAAPQQVAGPAAEQQQAAEGQRVGVDDPLQVAAGEVERVLDVRQCDVDDGRVEHDHELCRRDDGEGQAQPARRVAC
jgi:hypothetical protein